MTPFSKATDKIFLQMFYLNATYFIDETRLQKSSAPFGSLIVELQYYKTRLKHVFAVNCIKLLQNEKCSVVNF